MIDKSSTKFFHKILIILPALFLIAGLYWAAKHNTIKLSKMDKTNVNTVQAAHFDLGSFRKEHSDIYAGAKIDEKGKIVLKLVKDSKIGEIQELKDDRLIIEYVKYSYKELESIMEKLAPRMVELGIQSMALDEVNNIVDVYIEDKTDEKVNRIKEVCSFPALVFRNAEGGLEF